MPLAWGAVKVWKNMEPSMPRLPIPWNLVVLLFQLGVSRAMECKGLDRRAMGLYQVALGDDAWALSWLQWFCSDLPASAALVSVSSVNFRDVFCTLLRSLGISGFTLSSLWTGGATQQFNYHRNLVQLQYAGRWSNEKTVRHYLQEALSRRISYQFSADVLSRMVLAQSIHPYLVPTAASFQQWVGESAWEAFWAGALRRGHDEQQRRLRLGATRYIQHGMSGADD